MHLNQNEKPRRNLIFFLKFTKPASAKWFTDKLTALLQATGIDSFKFDAGESSFSPADPDLNATKSNHPLAITTDYLNTVSTFGSMIEVRSGFRNQEMAAFLRINDKDSGDIRCVISSVIFTTIFSTLHQIGAGTTAFQHL